MMDMTKALLGSAGFELMEIQTGWVTRLMLYLTSSKILCTVNNNKGRCGLVLSDVVERYRVLVSGEA